MVALADEAKLPALQERLQALAPSERPAKLPELVGGSDGLCAAAAWSTADLVVTGIVGCAGLLPTWLRSAPARTWPWPTRKP